MKERLSRREFLTKLSSIYIAGCGLSNGLSSNQLRAQELKYKLLPWQGDNYILGHKMRDGQIPIGKIESRKNFDFVIIGGGISGLTSAYKLRNSNYLLLEQYADLGGQARGGNYNGIGYTLGSAYLSSIDGELGKLLDELKLKPVQINEHTNSWYYDGKFEFISKATGLNQNDLSKNFNNFFNQAKLIWNKYNLDNVSEINTDNNLSKLDDTLFASCVKDFNPRFLEYIDNYLMSSLCGGINKVSAWAAYSTLSELVTPIYVLPGQNPTLAKTIAQKIDQKNTTVKNAFVWSIEMNKDGAKLYYSDSIGLMHEVNCKHLIITTIPMVASRLVSNLPDDVKANLMSLKNGSYLVANLCLSKQVFNKSYDNWMPSQYEFRDFTIAETPYEILNTYEAKMGSVMTVYKPFENGAIGRSMLLAGDRFALISAIIANLQNIFGNSFEDNIEQVVLSRFGHAMAIAVPGYLKKISIINQHNIDSLSFAHCSLGGLPCVQSAVTAANNACNRALRRKVG